jgi:hypothetical protein
MGVRRLSQSAGLALRFHEAENIVFSNRSLDVSNNASALVVDELHTDLGDTTSGTSSSQNLDDLSELNGGLSILHH